MFLVLASGWAEWWYENYDWQYRPCEEHILCQKTQWLNDICVDDAAVGTGPLVERDNLAPYVGQPRICPLFSTSHTLAFRIIVQEAKLHHFHNNSTQKSYPLSTKGGIQTSKCSKKLKQSCFKKGLLNIRTLVMDKPKLIGWYWVLSIIQNWHTETKVFSSK